MKSKIVEIGNNSGLYIIEDFITAAECKQLIAFAKKMKFIIGAFEPKKGPKKGVVSSNNYNNFITFFREENKSKLLSTIKTKISKLTKCPEDYFDPPRVVFYKTGGGTEPHRDYIASRKKGGFQWLATFLIYLNDVEEGGETAFDELGLKVDPREGRAVLWYNFCGCGLPEKGDKTFHNPKRKKLRPTALHSVCPLGDKERWVLVFGLCDRIYNYPSRSVLTHNFSELTS